MRKKHSKNKKRLICVKRVRQIIRENGKQAKPEFIDALEKFVEHKLMQAINTPNGKYKRLDASIAGFVFGNI